MASASIVVDFTKWPELVHGIRREVVALMEAEAGRAAPEVREALLRVAAKFDAGLTDLAATDFTREPE